MRVSQRAFARAWGKSRGAVQKAIATGRLPVLPDGRIDLAQGLAAVGATRAGMRPVPAVALGAIDATLREEDLPPPPQGRMTYMEAKTAHEVLKAQERRFRLQKARGEVVDRRRAEDLVFRLGRQERDAWLNWPARVASLMAAELGVSANLMQTTLERYVRDHLHRLAEITAQLG